MQVNFDGLLAATQLTDQSFIYSINQFRPKIEDSIYNNTYKKQGTQAQHTSCCIAIFAILKSEPVAECCHLEKKDRHSPRPIFIARQHTRDTNIAILLSVRLSVCLSRSGVVSKRLNMSSIIIVCLSHGSRVILLFLILYIFATLRLGHPYTAREYMWGI